MFDLGSRVSDFSRNLREKNSTSHIKIEQKQWAYSIFAIFVLSFASTGVVSNLYYNLSYIHFTSSLFVPSSTLASATALLLPFMSLREHSVPPVLCSNMMAYDCFPPDHQFCQSVNDTPSPDDLSISYHDFTSQGGWPRG